MASYPPPQQYPYPPPPKPRSGGAAVGIIMAIVGALLALVAVVGVLAVLAMAGVRKYIANAKTMEARNSVRMMGIDAQSVWGERQALCPSASAPVPHDIGMVRGRKYMSAASDWSADKSRDGGFACLGFSMSTPQHYQYAYESDGTGLKALAHGDLNGDGIASTFELRGQKTGEVLTIAPQILETNPDE